MVVVVVVVSLVVVFGEVVVVVVVGKLAEVVVFFVVGEVMVVVLVVVSEIMMEAVVVVVVLLKVNPVRFLFKLFRRKVVEPVGIVLKLAGKLHGEATAPLVAAETSKSPPQPVSSAENGEGDHIHLPVPVEVIMVDPPSSLSREEPVSPQFAIPPSALRA